MIKVLILQTQKNLSDEGYDRIWGMRREAAYPR